MNFVRWSWLDHPAHNRDLWSPVWHIPEALTYKNSEGGGIEPDELMRRDSWVFVSGLGWPRKETTS